jgi:hypothetical protein
MHVISFLNHFIKLQPQFFHLLGAFVQVKHLEFGGYNSFMELFLQSNIWKQAHVVIVVEL